MLRGDSLAVFLALLSFGGGTAITAYSVEGAKRRNLLLGTAFFVLLAFGWWAFPTGVLGTPAQLAQRLLFLVPILTVCLVSLIVRDRLERLQLRVAEASTAQMDNQRKRQMIADGRSLVTAYTQGLAGEKSFRQFIEGAIVYPALRSHLSSEYMTKLRKPRVAYLTADQGVMHPLAAGFLDELDRLEREWGLN